jgi:hypothetical protein
MYINLRYRLIYEVVFCSVGTFSGHGQVALKSHGGPYTGRLNTAREKWRQATV